MTWRKANIKYSTLTKIEGGVTKTKRSDNQKNRLVVRRSNGRTFEIKLRDFYFDQKFIEQKKLQKPTLIMLEV